MVAENDLIDGQCYFLVFYYDKDLRIPDIRTLIYIGKNTHRESEGENPDKDLWVFQDPESYLKYGPVITKPKKSDCKISRFDRKSLFSIYDWSGMLAELSENKKAQNDGKIFG